MQRRRLGQLEVSAVGLGGGTMTPFERLGIVENGDGSTDRLRHETALLKEHQSSDLRNRKMLMVSIAVPSNVIAASCGHSTGMPMPFKNTARITIRK